MENKYSNKYVIETGIGLQDVDGLKNSAYFLSESNRYIKGEISLEELDRIVTSYYENKPAEDERQGEADKVATRIAKIISEDSFVFSVGQLMAIHRSLFDGVLEHPGEPRTYNFTKKEWVLDGASVTYGDFRELQATLQYDFEQERKFRYDLLTIDGVIDHLALFVSNLWQIHAFEEGNTRATAVFFIKYLRTLGFDVTNDTFAKNAWYFRNSLVRANYTNIVKGIHADRSYLVLFLRNLVLGETNQLKNKDLHISSPKLVSVRSREARILRLMKEEPDITADRIAKELGVSLRTAKSLIKALENEGKVKRVDGRKFGRWVVADR